jgi:hypothetical protein
VGLLLSGFLGYQLKILSDLIPYFESYDEFQGIWYVDTVHLATRVAKRQCSMGTVGEKASTYLRQVWEIGVHDAGQYWMEQHLSKIYVFSIWTKQ